MTGCKTSSGGEWRTRLHLELSHIVSIWAVSGNVTFASYYCLIQFGHWQLLITTSTHKTPAAPAVAANRFYIVGQRSN